MTGTRRRIQRLFLALTWGLLCWCVMAHAPARAAEGENWNALTVWQDMPPLYVKAPFPADLRSKTLILVWNGKHNGDRLLRRFAQCLRQAVPDVRFVPTDRPVFFSPIAKDMPEAESSVRSIRALRPDMAILATGDCRVCAAWMAVEAVLLEKAGIPTVALVTQPFYKTYQNVCRNLRMEPLACVAVPHPVAVISAEKVDAKALLFFEEFQKLFPSAAIPACPCAPPSAAPGE